MLWIIWLWMHEENQQTCSNVNILKQISAIEIKFTSKPYTDEDTLLSLAYTFSQL
jgi:hypothetical protein